MATADELRRLADLVERIETEGATVREMTPHFDDGDALVADLTLALPTDEQATAPASAVSEASTESSTGQPRVDAASADTPRPVEASADGVEASDTGSPGADATGDPGPPSAEDATVAATDPVEPDDAEGKEPDAPETGEVDDAEGREPNAPETGEVDAPAGPRTVVPDATEEDTTDPPEEDAPDATQSAAEAEEPESGEREAVHCRHPDCDESFDSRHGMRVHAAKVHREDDGDAAPVYTDPDALREAYDRCDTFAEMTDFLDVAVTPATVRRHMVDHGIHEPSSRSGPDLADVDADLPAGDEERGGEAADAERGAGEANEEPPAADDASSDDADPAESDAEADHGRPSAGGVDPGALPEPGADLSVTLEAVRDRVDESVDLPEGVTLAAVVEAVESGRTLRDVSEALDLERDRTRTLLSALGLADLVTGRLSERPAEEETATFIDARLRRFADEGAEEAH